MRGETVRTEGRALRTLSREDFEGLIEAVLDTLDDSGDEVDLVHSADLKDTEPEGGDLIIHPGKATAAMRTRAASNGATLWDEDDIALQVGRAVMKDLGAEYGLDLGSDEGISASPLNVDRDEALELAGPYTGEDAVALLEMIPHSLFDFKCRCIVDDGEVREKFDSEGSLALDLRDGDLTPLEFEDIVSIPETEAGELLHPNVDLEDAPEKAKTRLIQELSRDVRLEKEKRQTQVYEKRTIKPPRDTVKLEGGQLVYRGIWTVKGGSTDVIIDATTGEVLAPTTTGGVELV